MHVKQKHGFYYKSSDPLYEVSNKVSYAAHAYELHEHCLKDYFANFTKLQPSIHWFNKMPLQSQLIILAPVSAVCKPIFLLSCYYRIRLIITGDDSLAGPG